MSISPDCSARKRCWAESGTYLALVASPSTAAATALHMSMSRPDHLPWLSGSEKPPRPTLTPQISWPRFFTTSRVDGVWAEAASSHDGERAESRADAENSLDEVHGLPPWMIRRLPSAGTDDMQQMNHIDQKCGSFEPTHCHQCTARKSSSGASYLPRQLTLRRRTTTCAAPHNSAGELLFARLSSPAGRCRPRFSSSLQRRRFAQGGPPAMPVSVAAADRQARHAMGRIFRALRGGGLGRGARPRLGLHREAAFQGRPARQGRRSAVHHRQAAVTTSPSTAPRPRSLRNKAQVGLAELQVQRGASLINVEDHHRGRRTTSARPTSPSRAPSSRPPKRRCARPSSTSTGPTCARRSPAASPTARSMPAT